MSDVYDAYWNLRTNDQIVQLYLSGYLTEAQADRDIAEYAYQRGAASLIDFLDAERSYRTTQRVVSASAGILSSGSGATPRRHRYPLGSLVSKAGRFCNQRSSCAARAQEPLIEGSEAYERVRLLRSSKHGIPIVRRPRWIPPEKRGGLKRVPTVPQLRFLLRRKPYSLAFDQHNTTFAKSF